jgi:hypothetical protein
MMARRKVEVVEELEEVEEVAEDLVPEAESIEDDDEAGDEDLLTAKQAATALGTDGRTLRKFLRKKFGLVGQGQRWAIRKDDLETLRAEFAAHLKSARSETKSKTTKSKTKAEEIETIDEVEELDNDELEELEDISEDDLDSLLDEDFDEVE